MRAIRPPGLLRPQVNPDVVMMLCTAGHVDHGKTSLVKLLTGCETDRLKIEQERGMTIELGFAPCFLGGNLCVGIVDVPGHERFVRNMVAGVSGIAMTILVIAADDGLMPQTIEHFQIMDLLGVRYGVIALTKIDLVDAARIEAVSSEIRTFFKGTFLENAPICPLSSETGDGFFDFYDTLLAGINQVITQQRRSVFRMPIERVFAQHGYGVVITGIPIDGQVHTGDQLELSPGGQVGRVRSIQRFLREAEAGGAGQCLALNVPDFSKRLPVRGQVVAPPGYVIPAQCFTASLRAVPGLDLPLRNGEEVKFHAGTSEEVARVYLLEGTELHQSGAAVIVTQQPTAAAIHDRFILRRMSPTTTVAGGIILDAAVAPLRPRRKDSLDRVAAYRGFFDGSTMANDVEDRAKVAYALAVLQPSAHSIRTLSRFTLLTEEAVCDALETLCQQEQVMRLGDELFVHHEVFAQGVKEIASRLEACVARKTLSITTAELRKGLEWPPPLWVAVQHAIEAQRHAVFRGEKVIIQAAIEGMDDRSRILMEKMLALYETTRWQSPHPDELSVKLGAQEAAVNRMLDLLCNQGHLIRLSKAVILSRSAFLEAQDGVVRAIQEKGMLDSADFKYIIDSSRKYALAILDFLDARQITVRNGNIRKLSPNYEKRLIR